MKNVFNHTAVEKKIGITFTDHALLRRAFVHRSFLNETKETLHSNERLEFLGDAILSFLSSHYLFTHYPDLPEGMLTNIRSSIVKTEALATASIELGLGEFLLLSKGEEEGGGRQNHSLLANVFEALLGAVYLDQGIAPAKKLVSKVLFPKVAGIIAQKSYIDFKSKLQEKVQEKIHESPLYTVVKSEGKDHEKIFWVEVLVGGNAIGRGKGRSKQEAEQHAARIGLKHYTKTSA